MTRRQKARTAVGATSLAGAGGALGWMSATKKGDANRLKTIVKTAINKPSVKKGSMLGKFKGGMRAATEAIRKSARYTKGGKRAAFGAAVGLGAAALGTYALQRGRGNPDNRG